jgi:hypothetical protein
MTSTITHREPTGSSILNQVETFDRIWRAASLEGSAGIAPLSVTVIEPQAFANWRASLNCFSSCRRKIKEYYDVNTAFNLKVKRTTSNKL